jgi:hypothetical protein
MPSDAELPERASEHVAWIQFAAERTAQSSTRYGEDMAKYYQLRIDQVLSEWKERGEREDDRELVEQLASIKQEAIDANKRASERWDAAQVLQNSARRKPPIVPKPSRKKVVPPTQEEIERRDLHVVQKALWRYRYLREGAQLVKDTEKATGRVGRSRVYFLRPTPDEEPNHGKGVLIIAKCDVEERAKKEMDRIGELRFLQLPLRSPCP